MRQPPEAFAQLQALQWGAPLITGFGVFMSAWAHGVASTALLACITAVSMLAAWGLALVAVWGSQWGSRHQLSTVAAEFLFFVVPWSTMLLPHVVTQGPWQGAPLSAAVVLMLLLALWLSAWWHARACHVPVAGTASVNWPPCSIDLRQSTLTIQPGPSASKIQPWPLALVGGSSVVVYRCVSSLTSGAQMLWIGEAVAMALGLWMCLMPLGRTLGQAWMLHRLERRHGVRVCTSRLGTLQKERQQFVMGRWWMRAR